MMLNGEQCQPQAVHWHPELTPGPGPGRSLTIPARSAEMLYRTIGAWTLNLKGSLSVARASDLRHTGGE